MGTGRDPVSCVVLLDEKYHGCGLSRSIPFGV